MELICPVCGKSLRRDDNRFFCCLGHSFDVARQGHVNLLPVQQKHSLNPGDTKQQVAARRRFLDAGFYAPIADTLIQTAREMGAQGPIVDVGCGEGYYSARLARALDAELVGLDISKEAVRLAAGKYKGHTWLCATASHIPVSDGSAGLLTSLFALTLPEEFRRVLRPDGLYMQVLAAQDHLLGLKSVIYPRLDHKQKDPAPELAGFERIRSVPIRFSFTTEKEQVGDLLSMTPHLYRISKEGAARLAQTESLTDTASCVLNVYRPV